MEERYFGERVGEVMSAIWPVRLRSFFWLRLTLSVGVAVDGEVGVPAFFDFAEEVGVVD